jgi:oligopeptide transport system substrate-binding protein
MFSCLKNAQKIITGQALYGTIGVSAKDEETVVFTLEYPYFDFLRLCSETPAIPCNETFFEATKGRYGLSVETSISNGAFYVADWNYDPYWNENYIELYRNENIVEIITNEKGEEQEVFDTIPHSIFYNIKPQDDDINDYEAGDIDGFKLADYDKKILGSESYKYAQTKSYTLFANPQSSISDPRLMQVLAGINFEFNEDLLETGKLVRARGIIPEAVSVMGKSYRKIVSDQSLLAPGTDLSKRWSDAMSDYTEGIGDVKITVSETFPEPQLIYDLTDNWRETFGVNFLVEIVSESEFDLKQSERNYDLILLPLTAEKNDPTAFFDAFSGGFNTGLSSNQVISTNIGKLKYAQSLNEAAEYLQNAEKSAINSGLCIPLFYGYEYFVYNKNASDIEYIPFSRDIIMRKAKMY